MWSDAIIEKKNIFKAKMEILFFPLYKHYTVQADFKEPSLKSTKK